jgi:hypothetical protein
LNDLTDENLYPLSAQKNAEKMVRDSGTLYSCGEKIRFLLISMEDIPRECVWLDPHFGFYAHIGSERKGFRDIKDLPPGSLIVNQRYESKDKE